MRDKQQQRELGGGIKMTEKQQLLDEYAEFLICNGFDIEGMGYQLKGLKVEEVNKDDLQEAFELINEINKVTQEFKSKFYGGTKWLT